MDAVIGTVVYYIKNFLHNIINVFTGMDTTRWFRLVAIVGGYLLLRPLLLKLGERFQRKQHEAAVATRAGPKARINPNTLRSGWVEPIEEEDEGEEQVTGVEWGKKARKRQLNAEKREIQQRLKEEQDEKEIKDLLVDYVEGEDGW